VLTDFTHRRLFGHRVPSRSVKSAVNRFRCYFSQIIFLETPLESFGINVSFSFLYSIFFFVEKKERKRFFLPLNRRSLAHNGKQNRFDCVELVENGRKAADRASDFYCVRACVRACVRTYVRASGTQRVWQWHINRTSRSDDSPPLMINYFLQHLLRGVWSECNSVRARSSNAKKKKTQKSRVSNWHVTDTPGNVTGRPFPVMGFIGRARSTAPPRERLTGDELSGKVRGDWRWSIVFRIDSFNRLYIVVRCKKISVEMCGSVRNCLFFE